MDRDYDYLIETVDYNTFTRSEEVDLVVYAFTDLGMKVAINNRYTGMVYKGPGIVKDMKKELISILKKENLKNIKEAVGINA